MLINLRNALMSGKKGPTARDYILDSALYDWDGIENYSFGVRDDTINFWQDLIASKRFTPRQIITPSSIAGTTPNARWAPTGWMSVLEECGGGQCDDATLISTSSFTVEFVFTNYTTQKDATSLRTRVKDSQNGFQINIPPVSGKANPIFFKPSDIQNEISANHSVVFTSSGTNITVYGDGVFRKNVSITSYQMTNYLLNKKPIKIGAYNVDRLTAQDGQFNGILHAIRSHSRAFSASEIAENYATDVIRFGLS